MQTNGLRQYLYEHVFYEAIEQTKSDIDAPIMVSGVKELRARVDEKLAEQGTSMSDPRASLSAFLGAVDSTLSENIEGYQNLFTYGQDADGNMTLPQFYSESESNFMNMVGVDTPAHGAAQPGPLGPRLPLSPYDPRFSSRFTVKNAGVQELFVRGDDIDDFVDGDPSRVAGYYGAGFKFFSGDEDEGRFREAGEAYRVEDAAGLSELMGYMTAEEYRTVAPWVLLGGRSESGATYDPAKFMSPEAVRRATSILSELRRDGIPYKIARDRRPGQITARIEGTSINVRITDTRENEQYVGRIYDGGVSMYFSTNARSAATKKRMGYEPSARDCVNLVRLAMGQPVERTDGEGYVGQVGTHKARNGKTENDAYLRALLFSSVYGDLPGYRGSKVLVQKNLRNRNATSQYFATADDADKFVRDSVDVARDNFSKALDVDGLLDQFTEYEKLRVSEFDYELEAADEFVPTFSTDETVASVQRGYWDVLTGKQQDLLLPGASEAEYQARLETIGGMNMSDGTAQAAHDMLMRELTYQGSPVDKVRQHAVDAPDLVVGQVDPHPVFDVESESFVDRRFDPVMVSRYMNLADGFQSNDRNLVSAMRKMGNIDAKELMGETSYNQWIADQMLQFDDFTAESMEDSSDPFIARMGAVVRQSLENNAVTPTSIMIDANGLVRYEGSSPSTLLADDAKNRTITGELGQIFSPGEKYGEITTRFNSGANYMFVPGYEATIRPQLPGENKSLEERTILRGYEQLMSDQILYTIASDLVHEPYREEFGSPTNLTSVYRRLYDTRHSVDFFQESAQEGLSEDLRDALLRTEGRRVLYGNDVESGSTINADYFSSNGIRDVDLSNDNTFDPYVLTGGRNVSILTEEGDGFYDPIMTGGATNQGVVRYLTESAQVTPEGEIVRGELDDRTPLMKHEVAQYMAHNPFDRQQMTASNLMQSAAVTEPTNTAMMTFGGWNFDDGLVVSKEFSSRHQIRGVDGQMRDLVVGDKLSDLHGNKGVISLIVDREAQMGVDFDPQDQNMTYAHQMFRMNPDLDVVMSPFSAVSRFNGGSAREMMEDPHSMVMPFKGSVPGVMGKVKFIVTHMAVDAKTRVYDDQALAAGGGRRASSQLAWALQSQGATEVMHEFYGANTSAVLNLREYLTVCGLDMDADGTLRVGHEAHTEDDQRALLSMPELQYRVREDGSRIPELRAMSAEFGQLIGQRAGDMEIPFPLTFPTGEELPVASGVDAPESWSLPVLSARLRSGRELAGDDVIAHNYTAHYQNLYEQVLRYRFAEDQLKDPNLSQEKRTKYMSEMRDAPVRAQTAFDSITSDIQTRRFSGKHNIVRDQVMANRLPHSATAVWTADPRLDIDQVSMGPAMAESLGVKADDHVLVWRDPILRDAGVRYLRVAIDDRLTGVAINPVMDANFDGDFDGDSVAVVRLHDKKAQQEALAKLSVPANLLEKGQVLEDGTHPLLIKDSLDVKVTQSIRPELVDTLDEIRLRANDIETDLAEGDIDHREAMKRRQSVVGELNDYFHHVLQGQYGDAALRFDAPADELPDGEREWSSDADQRKITAHLNSVIDSCVVTGAKGSMSKVLDYAKYLGAEPVEDSSQPHGYHFRNMGEPLVSRKDHEDVEYAQAVKSFGTGVAGKFSQRGVKSLRNSEISSVLELTYPVTQSILQSKHDPDEARRKYAVLMGPTRDLWRGRQLVEQIDSDGHRTWDSVRDREGNLVQADVASWEKQFMEIYTQPDGLNVSVNPEHVHKVAMALSDGDGYIRDIEADPRPGEKDLVSPMDRIAYDGNFDQLLNLAQRRENFFTGSQNNKFAPKVVSRNQQVYAAYDADLNAGKVVLGEPAVESLSLKDTSIDFAAKSKKADPSVIRTVGGVRRSKVSSQPVVPYTEPETSAEPKANGNDSFDMSM